MVDVLIVDDRPDGLLALEVALKRDGVNLVKASSGREALSFVKTHDFAVILLDVQMPELDGFQTAALIRKYPNHANTPILFVTAISKDDAFVYKGYNAGAVDYIFKPFDPQVLRSKVAVFIDLHLARQKLKDRERIDREREIAELEVENLNRYRTLADSIPHVVWKARPDGFFFYLNRVWLTYTGLTHEQSTGMGWQKVVHDEDLGKLLKIWLRAMDVGEPFEAEARIARADGELRWHLIRVIPERDDGARTTAWIGTCTDIHDVKLAEERLIEAERVAVAANEAKTNFLANMSHEIRTPMGAILGFSESLLRHEMSEDKRRHSVEAIHRSGKQLLGLIDEILDISKVEAGRLDVEKTNFDLLSTFTDLYTLMEVHARKHDLKLEFTFTSEIPYSVISDPTRLWQILVNVVGNAIKFTHRGRVGLEVQWADDRLRIRVRDTGIGIDRDSESMKLLFQPFSQLDTSTTRRFGGTGLGLYLSRRIAVALGGDITLEQPGPGWSTEFLIEIAARADGALRPVPVANAAPENIPADSSAKPDLHGVRVLLVEDLIDNQELVESFLASAGARVDIADNGQAGVEKALANDYDVVLMDIQMPGLDGYQATAQLRAAHYEKPIIALTAHALKEERARSLAAGCTDHLTKPINYPMLVKRVAEYAAPAG